LANFQGTVFTSRPFDQDGQQYRNPPLRSVALQRIELIAAILNVHREKEGILDFKTEKRDTNVTEEGRSEIFEVVDAAFDLGRTALRTRGFSCYFGE
jgi:hypothetical protein